MLTGNYVLTNEYVLNEGLSLCFYSYVRVGARRGCRLRRGADRGEGVYDDNAEAPILGFRYNWKNKTNIYNYNQ